MEHPIGQQYRDEWWYPRHPLTRESVIEDFAKFVDLLEKEPGHKLRKKDPHFRDQVELLVENAVPYTRIYEISEMKELQADLSAHLQAQGLSGDLHLPKANPTLLRANGVLFENGVKEQIERIYAADFDRFGHLWDFTRPRTPRRGAMPALPPARASPPWGCASRSCTRWRAVSARST